MYKYYNCFLENKDFKNDLIEYRCLCCNNDQQNFDEKLKKLFFNTYNKFILFQRKGIYPFEYMDNQEKLKESSLPEKEYFYSPLNMADITQADYVHAKRVCKEFEDKIQENIMICMFKLIHYCWLMSLKTLQICVLKYTNLNL